MTVSTSDGDNPVVPTDRGLWSNPWSSPERGALPLGWSLTPALEAMRGSPEDTAIPFRTPQGRPVLMTSAAIWTNAVEGYAADHPDDPDVEPLLETSRGQRDACLRWGRDCLGWAMYLFRKPGGSRRQVRSDSP